MTDSETPTAEPQQPAAIVGAVDIGANGIRLVIAQVLPGGRPEVLEKFQRAIRLGHDTFRRGRLRGQTMRAAIAILRDYRRIIDRYEVEHLRCVATSAIREASNSDMFLDRAFMTTGLSIEVIDTSEESRLTVSAVREVVKDAVDVQKGYTIIVDVGGGSTLLTLLEDGEIAASQSLRLGSVRLQEVLSTSYEPPDRSAELLRQQISNVISVTRGVLPLSKVRSMISVGGDARFAAQQLCEEYSPQSLQVVPKAGLNELVEKCVQRTPEELSRRHGMHFGDAETLNPALLVYQALLQATKSDEMIVSQVSMRDGLVLDLARAVTGEEDEALVKGVLHSALSVAEKYKVDIDHARNVSDLAVRLFDELAGDHRLRTRHRLLLQVAGYLHEVGGYVSSRAHHKHSWYLIANSEVFGLSREEISMVALVSRYHRRSCPKPTHTEYMSMPRDLRMVVSKLAALLRVADALDRSHAQQVRDFRCEHRGDELIIEVPGVTDLTLERRAVYTKGDLFEDIYGLRIRLEEGGGRSAGDRRARAME